MDILRDSDDYINRLIILPGKDISKVNLGKEVCRDGGNHWNLPAALVKAQFTKSLIAAKHLQNITDAGNRARRSVCIKQKRIGCMEKDEKKTSDGAVLKEEDFIVDGKQRVAVLALDQD